MKKLLQSLKSGEITLVETPVPQIGANQILVESRASLVSAGTERMLLSFGKGNLVQKAMQQPDKVKQTIQKARTDGIQATLSAVQSKLGQPIPLGYCNAGIVRGVGRNVTGFAVGDRVACNGSHSELNALGSNLAAVIPDGVSYEEAAFVPLAAIALQSVRLAEPTFGETFCVMGLGLVGLMTVQFLKASGCRVIGADFSAERLALAESWGAIPCDLSSGTDPVAQALALTDGHGVDGVIIAAATDSNDPIEQAPKMCRKRGRVVLVGVSGLNLARDAWFEKEITFQVSCSYGPGRYDPAYEEGGVDYPYGFVRWTEQRNFEAVLAAIKSGALDVRSMISHSMPFSDAEQVYARLSDQSDNSLGLVLTYPEGEVDLDKREVRLSDARPAQAGETVCVIGAGGFGGRTTLPGLTAAGARIKTIVSKSGLSGTVEGERAGAEISTTDFDAAIADPEIDSVVITTRHDTHGWMTEAALRAGKHVFVEKPLGLTQGQIDRVETALAEQEAAGTPRHLMVGFNRRFSPFSIAMKERLDSVTEPKCLIATINAGALPASHWAHDSEQGGGRIIGEGCHFIDLLRYFAGAPIVDVVSTRIGQPTRDGITEDKMTVTLSFADGSIGTLHYFANGPKTLSKERYEAFAGEKWLMMDNFQKLTGQGWGKKVAMKGKQDKGHHAALKAFMDAVTSGGPAPIPASEVIEVSRATIRAVRPDDQDR